MKLSRPAFFTRYIAVSASRSRSAGSVWNWLSALTMPMLHDENTACSSIWNGRSKAASTFSAMLTAACTVAFGESTANSSPPRRASRSVSRRQVAQPLGRLHEQQVAVMMAEAVVHHLEAVEIDEHHRQLPPVLAISRATPPAAVAAAGCDWAGPSTRRGIFVQEARVRVVELARADLHARLEFEVRRVQRFGGAPPREPAVSMRRETNVSSSCRAANSARAANSSARRARRARRRRRMERDAEPRAQPHAFVAPVDREPSIRRSASSKSIRHGRRSRITYSR